MILADKIVNLRKRAGWSQEELAEKMGVSRQSISKWEGAQSVPDMNRILKLSEVFCVSTDYLLRDDIEELQCLVNPSEEAKEIENDKGETLIKVSLETANEYLEYCKKKFIFRCNRSHALYFIADFIDIFGCGRRNEKNSSHRRSRGNGRADCNVLYSGSCSGYFYC